MYKNKIFYIVVKCSHVYQQHVFSVRFMRHPVRSIHYKQHIINNLRCNWSESPVSRHIPVMAEFSSNLVQLRTHILSKITTQGTSHYNPDKDLILSPSIIHFVSWILICRHHRCIPNYKIITFSKLYRSLTTSKSRL